MLRTATESVGPGAYPRVPGDGEVQGQHDISVGVQVNPRELWYSLVAFHRDPM